MSDPRNRQYNNGEITVFWIPSKCIHATTCFRELIEVFNPGRRPWVNMEGAPTRRISEVVNKCPTQALTWKFHKDLSPEELDSQWQGIWDEETPRALSGPSNQVKIRIIKDGPIVVNGQYSVIGTGDQELKPTVMTSFCRCGGSRNMPYCDGTHSKIGFTD